MSQIELIRELRVRTGAGLLDCKNALEEAGWDMDKAIEILRKKGIAKAEKKLGRITKEGLIEAYIHPGAQLGVLVEVNCETDFVARTDEFKRLAHDIAMQIAATSPIGVKREEIPEEIINKEKEIYEAQAKQMGKPPHIIEKIVQSKMENFYKENVLLEQPFIKDPSITVMEYIKQHIAKFGENITVKRFVRFRLGEE